jgi:DNA helicase-2/ATP-dependent DNA helicase PcrA
VQATELSGGQGKAVRPEDMAGMRANTGALGVGAPSPRARIATCPRSPRCSIRGSSSSSASPTPGIVVIQGGAGSGKTTIGVHRMAFLAYNDRKRFTSDKMLVIVGSPALRAYISEVLPALGIGGVQVETFAEWAAHARRRAFPWLEAPVEENTPSAVTRYKTHP